MKKELGKGFSIEELETRMEMSAFVGTDLMEENCKGDCEDSECDNCSRDCF